MLKFKHNYRVELAKTLSQHFYGVWEGDKFLGHFPSITTYLQAYPTSEQLVAWMAKEGYHESREMRDEAGRRGTRIHLAIQDLLEGQVLQEANFTLEEWRKIFTFTEWHKVYKPEILAMELPIFSKKGKYAGRLDCIAKIDGQIVLIDWKSSRNLHNSFFLQIAAYGNAIEEMSDIKIDAAAVLQLGASNKNGYRFEVDEDWRKNYKIFLAVKKTWEYDNPKLAKEPPVLVLPESLKL